MCEIELSLRVESAGGEDSLRFILKRLICAGWVGRDKASLQAHIKELAQIGVPGPNRIPIFMNLSPYLITKTKTIEVISGESSGEVEYVVIKNRDGIYIGVGSDHTDRGFEKFGIPASKQICAKVIAPVVWPYQEVRDHWDQIIIRSWSIKDSKRMLHQEDTLATILNVEDLLERLPDDGSLTTDGMILFSGTVASKTGLVYAKVFEFEMEDPVLGRKIRHEYEVQVLPQYV